MGQPHPIRRGRFPAPILALAATLAALTPAPSPAAILINEIFPNPVGSETGPQEKVEIYNSGPGAVDLTGWAIDDAATIGNISIRAGFPEHLDPACSTNPVIQPGEFRVIFMGTGSAVLNNTGDNVYLVSDRLAIATVVHTVTFPGTVGEDQSWACVPNGTSSLSLIHI